MTRLSAASSPNYFVVASLRKSLETFLRVMEPNLWLAVVLLYYGSPSLGGVCLDLLSWAFKCEVQTDEVRR